MSTWPSEAIARRAGLALTVLLSVPASRAAPTPSAAAGPDGGLGRATQVFASDRKARLVGKPYDVVVVGGNLRAVIAALEARKAGAGVYLIAPRPTLGEDLAGTLMLDAAGEIPAWDSVTRLFAGRLDSLPEHLRLHDGESALPWARLTPNYVKVGLDSLLVENAIDFITSSMVSEMRRPLTGPPRFAVIFANRSGWNLVHANAVVDCSEGFALAARQGVDLAPFQPGRYRFFRYLMCGESPRGFSGDDLKEFSNIYHAVIAGWDVQAPPAFPARFRARLYRCEADFDLASDSPLALADVDLAFRGRTFSPLQADMGEIMGVVTPLRRVADQGSLDRAAASGYYLCNAGAEAFLLSPDERGSSYPLKLNAAAYRLGRLAAQANRWTRGGQEGIEADVLQAEGALTVSEIASPEASIPLDTGFEALPVLAETDVLVAGGGTCGAPAAIAAARAGVRTLVCEYHYQLGGTQTTGLLGHYYRGNRVGFTTEIDAGVAKLGSILNQTKAEYYRREIRQAGGKILYGTMVTGAILDRGAGPSGGRAIRGVTVVTPDGTRGVILAKVVIDSTGNADVAAACQAPTVFGGGKEAVLLQGTSINWRDIATSCSNVEVAYVDDRDADGIHQALLQVRRDYGVYRWDFAPYVASRERRHILGQFVVRMWDLARDRKYADTITQCLAPQDSHGPLVHDMLFLTTLSGPTRLFNARIPYRALLPDGISELLVTGLGISADRDAIAVMRMQPDLQNEGYAAGYAAAMAVKLGVGVADIPIRTLQNHLVEKQILDPRVLDETDTPALSDDQLRALLPAVVAATNTNLDGVWEFYAAGARAKPVLAEAMDRCPDRRAPEALHLAMICGMFGLPNGNGILIDFLKREIDVPALPADRQDTGAAPFAKALWDQGFSHDLCYGRRNSRKDQAIVALARSGNPSLAPVLVDLLRALPDDPAFSHLRAAALYLDAVPVAGAAPELARILAAIKGHAMRVGAASYPGLPPKAKRGAPVKELLVARALHKLGDRDGLAKAVLESYRGDPRKIFADFAQRVLETND